ncbi:MAG: murein biosynthesis integral membrane protein MurJ [Deltaproteobacteria bacterium]|jgi:putative peptidoglycan lipid II flippase|nr:murein biosynthesis integral membrane protein MurJ [Deltaproteobacteria bacterium]
MPEQRTSPPDNALTLGKGIFASRLLGFVRDAAIAALLGGGWTADALLLAFRLPNLARALLTEGAFAYCLVPAYREIREQDAGRAWVFIRSISIVLVCLFGVLAATGALFSEGFARIVAPGFAAMPEVLGMASGFLRLCLLSLPLAAGAAAGAAALMAEGEFRPPAYGAALSNALVIASAGAALVLFGAGDGRAPYALCVGAIAGSAAQWLCQLPPLGRLGFSPRGPVSLGDPLLRRSLGTLPGSLFGAGGHQANILLATFLASFMAEGSISSLYFAERLIGFPVGLIGASIGLASLSELSLLTASARNRRPDDAGDRDTFRASLNKSLRLTLFFALPAAVGTACLARPLTALVFGHGEFGAAALLRTSDALVAYAAGLPALAVARPLLAGLGALGDSRSSMRAAFASLAATFGFGAVALAGDAPWGLALAVSLAAWTGALRLLRALAGHGVSPLPSRSWVLKNLAACAVMLACILPATALFSSVSGKAAIVIPGVLIYFAAALCLRMDEAGFALQRLRSFLGQA